MIIMGAWLWLAVTTFVSAGVEETQYHTTDAAWAVKEVERVIGEGATHFVLEAQTMPGSKYNHLPGARVPWAVPDWEWVQVYSLRLPDPR